jgi:DNA gyrase subunit A
MIITAAGTLIRMSLAGISVFGRYAQGVKLINIRDEDEVATVAYVDKYEEPELDVEAEEGTE